MDGGPAADDLARLGRQTGGELVTMRLNVLTYRTGPADRLPLVLLHAFPLDSRMWDEVGPLVPGPRTVLALDLPGVGGSPDVDLPTPSIAASAEAVAGTLRHLGLDRVVLAGLSMGGYVALALVARDPDLVAGLGLLDTRSTADTPEVRANRLRIADVVERRASVGQVRGMGSTLLGETTRMLRPELGERVSVLIDQQPPAGIAWSLRAMAARPDRTQDLHAYAGPTLVLVGDEDVPTPVEAAEAMVGVLPSAHLVVVPHVGHLTALEDPPAVAAALGDLAQRADAAAARHL